MENYQVMENYYPSSTTTDLHYQPIKDDQRRGSGRKKSGGGGASVVKLSTDPQSVAARQRRHRISDRFRVLKSLVPGGSKMDTVSMLEEAINYVKFLKTQIWLHQAAMMIPPDQYSEPDIDIGLLLPPPFDFQAAASAATITTGSDGSYMIPPSSDHDEEMLCYNYATTAASTTTTTNLPPLPYCSFHGDQEDQMQLLPLPLPPLNFNY